MSNSHLCYLFMHFFKAIVYFSEERVNDLDTKLVLITSACKKTAQCIVIEAGSPGKSMVLDTLCIDIYLLNDLLLGEILLDMI